MIKLSDFGLFDTPEPQAKSSAAVEKRQYEAAKHTRKNRGWTDHPQGANWILRCDNATLRARARDMSKNSPHFRKFVQMAKSNIVGHKGIQLQCDVKLGGKPYTVLNSRIEKDFWQWGKRENCTLSGKMNWIQAQQLCVEMLVRDGEALVEHIDDADNEFGYAIKFWNADWLDETHNEILKNGNRVMMGVEIDRNDKPVGYWLTEPPSENFYGYSPTCERRYRRRVSAERMSHIFLVTEDESQVRGVTWFHAALVQGKDLHEYAGGVVQSAVVAARTFGFLKQTAGEDIPPFSGDPSQVPGQATCQPDITIDKRSLAVNLLDPGMEFQQFDPKQPTQNHAEFMDSMLGVLASALGVPGFSLAGDMSAVNFSSARVGLNEERDAVWKFLQEFICDTFCRDVFRRWLTAAWLKGRVEMTARDFTQLMEPTWRPRGWDYINPKEDVQSSIDAIANNLLTYKEHFNKKGVDLEDWLDEKKAEMDLFKAKGITYGTADQLAAATPVKKEEPPPDPPQDDDERGFTNGRYAN